jgi:hypothetical protein
LLGILADAATAGHLSDVDSAALPRTVGADLRALRESVAPSLTERQLARAIMGWTQLIGCISFELFGHLHNVIHDYGAHFDFQLRRVVIELGLRRASPPQR